MKQATISDETLAAILSAAWRMIVGTGRLDASMGAIAREAGVTRQSLYLAFGSRAGLLVAMARQADATSRHSLRMAQLAATPDPTRATLLEFTAAWLDHLPEIFPVGRLLLAAAASDADAAAVLRDRLEGSLHGAFLAILRPLHAAGALRAGRTPREAADLAWSLTHLDAWRHLVVEHGWSPEAFRADRLALVEAVILRPAQG